MSNTPQILHFWAGTGEWPAGVFPQAVASGTPLLTQANVKSRWPDGSIRDAVLAFVVPLIPSAGAEVVITFNRQQTCNCEPGKGLSKADILSSAWGFDAKEVLTPPPACPGCSNEVASARQILTRWDGVTNSVAGSQFWLYGSVVTELILAEHATKASDIGYRAAPTVRLTGSGSGSGCSETAIQATSTNFCATSVSDIAPGQFVTIYGVYKAETVKVCSVNSGSNSFQVGFSSCPNVDGRGIGGGLTGQAFNAFSGGLPALTGRWLPAQRTEERPLRPWFSAQFWSQLQRYKVEFHLGNYDTTKLQTQHFGLEFRVGSPVENTVYRYYVPNSRITPNHVMARPRTELGMTRADGRGDECTPEFWSQGYQPGCVSVRYPYEYWGSVVRIIPNYNPSFSIRSVDIDARVAKYNQ